MHLSQGLAYFSVVEVPRIHKRMLGQEPLCVGGFYGGCLEEISLGPSALFGQDNSVKK